jgi:hypothetical protein
MPLFALADGGSGRHDYGQRTSGFGMRFRRICAPLVEHFDFAGPGRSPGNPVFNH